MNEYPPPAFAFRKPRSAAFLFLRHSFTLVEMLAAMAIFAIIFLVIAQIVTTTSASTILSNRNADAAAQARLAFERIGVDLNALVNRPDADFLAGTYDTTGNYNPFLLIFSSVGSSSSGNRAISTVAYAMNTSSDNYNRLCLMRATSTIPWTTSAFMGYQANGYPYAITNLAPASTAYNILAPGVIGLAIGFQLYPDSQPITLMDGSTVANGSGATPGSGNALGQIVYSPPLRTGSTYVDTSRIAAIVIGVVTLDLNDLNQLSAAQVQTLAQQFSTTDLSANGSTPPANGKLPANGQLPVQVWQPIINSLSTNTSLGIPLPTLKALQAYDRFYPISSYGNSSSN